MSRKKQTAASLQTGNTYVATHSKCYYGGAAMVHEKYLRLSHALCLRRVGWQSEPGFPQDVGMFWWRHVL